ncbi:MAG: NUDIX hydrolase [Rhizobiales bacterium]|nr:NUDIX hydrolase [Hyphomicrobiales bacterium]MBN9001609.1 NUDIX hydrolase [Hyphomicrobiales bacterium]
MAERDKADDIADRALCVEVSPPRALCDDGFRPYERYTLQLPLPDGETLTQRRDILRGGRVAGVLPIDLARDRVVLLRQFRFTAHLANGNGDMIEIVAGRVDGGESEADAARRECVEETGVAPDALVRLYSVLPTPGLTDELVTSFVGFVDSSRVVTHGGLASETEHIETLVVSIDTALDALRSGRIFNALTVSALQWLALNRARLRELNDAAVKAGGVVQG